MRPLYRPVAVETRGGEWERGRWGGTCADTKPLHATSGTSPSPHVPLSHSFFPHQRFVRGPSCPRMTTESHRQSIASTKLRSTHMAQEEVRPVVVASSG